MEATVFKKKIFSESDYCNCHSDLKPVTSGLLTTKLGVVPTLLLTDI